MTKSSPGSLTGLQRERDALPSSAESQRLLVETMLQGVVQHDANGIVLSMNPAAERILGRSPEEYLGSTLREMQGCIREDGSPFSGSAHPAMLALRTGEPVREVVMGVYNPRHGAYRWLSMDAIPLFLSDTTQPSEVFTVFTDVTDRKQKDAALLDAHRRTKTILESIADAFFTVDDQWRLVTINPAAESGAFGRPATELLGKVIWEAYPAIVGSPIHQQYLEAMANGICSRYETKSILNGRWYEVFLFPRPGALDVCMRDIDDRKCVEQALRESEARYRHLFENLCEGFALHEMIFDATGRPVDYRFIEINKTFETMTGLVRDEVIGRTILEVIPSNEPYWLEKFGQVVVTGEPVHFENHARGLQRDYEVIAFRPRTGQFAALFLDITDRKRLESLYTVLSEVNEAIVRTRSKERLLDQVCQILVARGQFPLVWIGQVQDERVTPIAVSGSCRSYLEEVCVELHGPSGSGPTGTCIRERRPIVNDDFDANPSTAMWREAASRYGFRASAAFPLQQREEPFGAITLYAERPSAFDAAQVKLLSALAADLSFALDALEIERHRADAIQALRKSERLFSLIHDRSPFAIVLTRMPEGKIVSVNDAFLEMFECQRDNVTGRSSVELGINDPDSRGRVLAELQNRGYVREFECTRTTLTGKERIVSLSLDWVEIGNDKLLLTTVQDITDRKHIEAALASANVELGQAVQRKNEFMAMLSHELRNPLATIKTSLFVIDKAEPNSERSHRALKAIDRQAAQLTRLVDDLLDMTRITHDKVRLAWNKLEVNELVRQSLEDHWAVLDQCAMHSEFLPYPQPLIVNGDSHRLAQVLGNLFQNATKFAPPGGTLRIMVEPDASHTWVEIRVVDAGTGMSKETLARLFQPFMQAETTLDRSRGGLGLGLALVKGLVELHGGTVEATSAGLGAGATFLVRLPLCPLAGAETGSTSAHCIEAVRPIRRRVLIIEDNLDAAETLREALEFCEHDAILAHNGSDGLARARELRPDVIICDIGLPGMSGYEFAKTIRADGTLARTKLIALSGYARSEDRDRALVAGFDCHLAKPPSLQALEELLAEPLLTEADSPPATM